MILLFHIHNIVTMKQYLFTVNKHMIYVVIEQKKKRTNIKSMPKCDWITKPMIIVNSVHDITVSIIDNQRHLLTIKQLFNGMYMYSTIQ